jgi:hypothetical protein
MANLIPPIPQDKITECHAWRDWFYNMGRYIQVAQVGGSPWTVAQGGTGVSTLTGYVKGNGSLPLSTVGSIPSTDVSGLGSMSVQASTAVSITGGTITGVTINGGTDVEKIEYNAPVTGFSYTIANATNDLILKPAGTLATGAVTMPATPVDGQVVRLSSTQIITALTVSANAGQTISAPVTTITANGYASWIYRLTDTNWYRIG